MSDIGTDVAVQRLCCPMGPLRLPAGAGLMTLAKPGMPLASWPMCLAASPTWRIVSPAVPVASNIARANCWVPDAACTIVCVNNFSGQGWDLAATCQVGRVRRPVADRG